MLLSYWNEGRFKQGRSESVFEQVPQAVSDMHEHHSKPVQKSENTPRRVGVKYLLVSSIQFSKAD